MATAQDQPPLMASALKVTWEKESSFNETPGTGSDWNQWGARKGEVRSLGPENTWDQQRHWNGNGRESDHMELVQQDYGGRLGEFKVKDPKILGFWWGQEPNAPSQIGSTGYYRHTAVPTTNDQTDSLSCQFVAEDRAGNTMLTTYNGLVMDQLEFVFNEEIEASYAPTFIGKSTDSGASQASVTTSTSPTFRHYHGFVEVFGQKLIRIQNLRLRSLNNAERRRYWNQNDPLNANEFPVQQTEYEVTARCIGDAQTFSSFLSKDLHQLAKDGDIGQATMKAVETQDENEFQVNFGSADDAWAISTMEILGKAEGGGLVFDLEFAGRDSEFQWVDQNSNRYFSS